MEAMDRFAELAVQDGVELRRWTVDGVEALDRLVLANLDHLRGFMPWAADEPLERTARRAIVESWQEGWQAGTDAAYGIFEAGELVGGCGVHRRIGPGGVEVGYWVDHRHLGRGIARRATAAAVDVAFAVDDVDRVEVHHDLANVFSRYVPERLGFELVDESTQQRALAPEESGVELIWRMTRQRWLAQRG